VVLVVKRRRPEAIDRRRLVFGKCHRIAVRAVQPPADRVEVLIEIFCLIRRIDEDVGFRDRSASEIINAEGSFVGNCAPVVGKLLTPISVTA
jgi:hypothetical protein